MVSTVNLLILWLSLTSTCMITLSAKEFGFTPSLPEATDAKELDIVSPDEKDSDFISLKSKTADKKEFDLFLLVLQWPGTFCQTGYSGCCFPLLSGKPKLNFVIHGLWPTYNDSSFPKKCTKTSFNLTQVKDLKDKLETNWPSLGCPSKESSTFWEQEWKKHGTCSEIANFTQYTYFETALKLTDKVNLLGTLTNKSISPNGIEYDVQKIIEAIKEKIGHKPDLSCTNLPGWNYTLLYQVYVCVDKDGQTFKECPFPLKNSRCLATTRFPCF